MGLSYTALFYFLCLTTSLSGFGMLLQIDGLYFPATYMVCGSPGTGVTEFERLASFVFGLVYVLPIASLVHAHFSGSKQAVQSACVAPTLYHLAGIVFLFPEALNPAQTSVKDAALIHAVFAALFVMLYKLR